MEFMDVIAIRLKVILEEKGWSYKELAGRIYSMTI